MEKGLIHIYSGDGKGKTTAAIGLAVRAAGSGKKVLFVQFLKGSNTGELNTLKLIPSITVLRNSKNYGFFCTLSKEEQNKVTRENNDNFFTAKALALNGSVDLIIFDEILDAINLEAIDCESVENFIINKPCSLELVLTGRNPDKILMETADYHTEMIKIKHPYDKGIKARPGIEF